MVKEEEVVQTENLTEEERENRLQDHDHVYRTSEWRPFERSDDIIVSSFGFKDRTGEDQRMFIRAIHGIEMGWNEIQIEREVIRTFTKKLDVLETQPEDFDFKFQGQDLSAILSADVQTRKLTLSVGGVPYY